MEQLGYHSIVIIITRSSWFDYVYLFNKQKKKMQKSFDWQRKKLVEIESKDVGEKMDRALKPNSKFNQNSIKIQSK